MHPKDAEGVANSVDPDQTAPKEQSLGLHCLPRPVCLKTSDHYGIPDQIWFYTVCHSVSIFWTYCCVLNPLCSNFRIIISIILDVPIFKFLRFLYCTGTVMILRFRTDRSRQTVQTQIRLFLAVSSGSTLFAIRAASFGCILFGKAVLFKF